MASASTIKAIDSASIHRITSGQVVIDLQSAVKELVENSLDAGATSIEVRFKDYGLKSIEVIDNGHGVAPEDYDSIALKHHTSKLASFDDLGTVRTFGFRGEALSSLCAVSSSVGVTTATADQAPMGTVLDFDRGGKIKHRDGKAARQRGTTVAVGGLFGPLPVRRKELERNSKREFGKALNLLQAYALVPCANENRGVRLTVSNHPSKGARSVQIRTDGSPSTRSAVSGLWGPKSLDSIVALDLEFDLEPERSSVLQKRGIVQEGTTRVKVKGLISKFAPGCGRASADRQFFYVNGRPCNLSKVQKTFNEVYRSFNSNQVPFLIADFQLPTRSCDINVSPDKRTIFIHSENNLVQALKISLEDAFSPSRSTFSVNEALSRRKSGDNRQQPRADRNDSAHEGEHEGEPSHEEDHPDDVGSDEETQSDPVVQSRETDVVEIPDPKPSVTRLPVRSRSQSQSSTAEVDQIMDLSADSEVQLRARDTEPEMATEVHDEAAEDILTADVTMSTEIAETPSRHDEDILDDGLSDAGAPAPRHAPLFLPSPTAVLSPLPVDTEVERAPSPPPRDSLRVDDEVEERPRKRQRTASPSPPTAKSRPVQMVLDTAGASWNLRPHGPQTPQGGRGGHNAVGEESETGSRARVRLRTQLSAFLAPGSQVENRPTEEVDEDLEGGDEGLEDDTEEAVSQSSRDKEISNQQQSDVDVPMNDEALEDSPANQTSKQGRETIDLTSEPMDEAEKDDFVGPSRDDDDESTKEYISQEEIVRTRTVTVTLRLNLERLTSTWSRLCSEASLERSSASDAGSSSEEVLQPSANVTNVDDAEAAERELARVIHKDDFSSFQVLGQFNLGFIIARRRISAAEDDGKKAGGTDDLFIVDQHAADEKYNFETLQQTTKFDSQKLFQPRSLELTAADELLAIENVDILRANGFEVLIDEDAPAGRGQRVKLAAQPVSKGTTFDMKDLEELLHLMQDRPAGQMVRCSKARAIFAMRACRKSVMIGKALTTSQMTLVVRHMGMIDQPWNCPHGRPTMRHLVSLNQVNHSSLRGRDVNWTDFAVT